GGLLAAGGALLAGGVVREHLVVPGQRVLGSVGEAPLRLLDREGAVHAADLAHLGAAVRAPAAAEGADHHLADVAADPDRERLRNVRRPGRVEGGRDELLQRLDAPGAVVQVQVRSDVADDRDEARGLLLKRGRLLGRRWTGGTPEEQR